MNNLLLYSCILGLLKQGKNLVYDRSLGGRAVEARWSTPRAKKSIWEEENIPQTTSVSSRSKRDKASLQEKQEEIASWWIEPPSIAHRQNASIVDQEYTIILRRLEDQRIAG